MELMGVAGILVIILAGLFFLIFVFRKKKKALKMAAGKLPAFLEEAKAIVLNVEHTGMTRSHLCQVTMQMQVFPEKGRNFVVEVRDILSMDVLSTLHTGAFVKVHYNPSNLKEVSLVKAA